LKTILEQISRFVQYVREKARELPALWAALRAYLQGLIAVLRLISIMMAHRAPMVGV